MYCAHHSLALGMDQQKKQTHNTACSKPFTDARNCSSETQASSLAVISDVFASWPLASSATTGLGTCLLFTGLSTYNANLVVPCLMTKCSVWILIPSSDCSMCGSRTWQSYRHFLHCASTLWFIFSSFSTITALQGISSLHNPPYLDEDRMVIVDFSKMVVAVALLSMVASFRYNRVVFVVSEFLVLWFNGLAYMAFLLHKQKA